VRVRFAPVPPMVTCALGTTAGFDESRSDQVGGRGLHVADGERDRPSVPPSSTIWSVRSETVGDR